jgi:F-type H+-transporting ATPase subunit b
MLAQVSTIASVAIDVDITAGFMAVLFLALYLVLQPLIITPYMKARKMRTEAVDGAREDATEDQARAEATIQKFEEEMRQARREAQEVRESMRGQGQQEHDDLVSDAHAEVQAKLDTEREKIATQVEEARKEIGNRAEALAQAMVDKVLPELG